MPVVLPRKKHANLIYSHTYTEPRNLHTDIESNLTTSPNHRPDLCRLSFLTRYVRACITLNYTSRPHSPHLLG